MNYSTLSTAKLIALVTAAQEIQKRNHPHTDVWQSASVTINTLAPIIAQRADK